MMWVTREAWGYLAGPPLHVSCTYNSTWVLQWYWGSMNKTIIHEYELDKIHKEEK